MMIAVLPCLTNPEQLMVGFHAEFEALQRATEALATVRDSSTATEASMETMNAMLDEALAQVDALLASREKGPNRGED